MSLFDLILGKREVDPLLDAKELTKEDLEVFLQINSVLLQEVELKILLKNIVDLTIKHLGCVGALFIRYNPKNHTLYPQIVSQGAVTDLAIRLLGEQLQSFEQKVNSNDTLSIQSFNSKKTIIGDDLSKFISPPAPATWTRMTQALYNMKTIVSVPVYTKSENFGVIVYSFNKSIENLSSRIVKVLELYTSQVAEAIERAAIYESISLKLVQIQAKNEDLQSLYNLTSQVSKSLDPTEVAQTAVNSLPQDKLIIGAILAEHRKEENVLQNIALTENDTYFKVTKVIQDPKQYKLSLEAPNTEFNLAIKAFKQSTPQFSNKLHDFLSPILPDPLISAVEVVLPIKSLASYPLIIRGNVIGTLTFLIKDKTVEELNESEKQLLGTYTYHITIALENAELYKQQKITQDNLENALMEVQALRQHEQDMIDIMGHELRTPISIVRNALGMLELELKNTGEIRRDNLNKFLDISMESARREVKLVETLLSSAKADSRGFQLIFEKIDLLDVINDSLEFFNREAEKKGLQIKYTKPNEEYLVYADRTRIQEIMDNLLSNAVKYTETGYIKIDLRKDNELSWIDVTDTGIGMNDSDLKSIGQKFYRVDQYMDNGPVGVTEKPNIIRPGGTGLGLYVTFSLIKVMDGKVDVKSQIGVGSTFSFGMPNYTGQESKQEQRKP